VFKLYGEVNSVKNTTMNIWLNDGVYIFIVVLLTEFTSPYRPLRRPGHRRGNNKIDATGMNTGKFKLKFTI